MGGKKGGDGCQFWDVKCHLAHVNPVLGNIAKTLDKPWQAASGVIATTMKGTPLEGVTSALSLGSRGHITEAVHAGVQGALSLIKNYVPGLSSVPFIGLATDFLGNQAEQIIAKNTGGTASAPNNMPLPDLGNILGGAVGQAIGGALGGIVNGVPKQPDASIPVRREPPPPVGNVAAVVQNAASVIPPPPPVTPSSAPAPGVKRKLRVFTPMEWAQFAADPRTAGGTQAWATP